MNRVNTVAAAVVETSQPSRGTPCGRWRRLAALCLLACGISPAWGADAPVRVATFNVSLYGKRAGEVLARLQGGDDPQARAVAEIIQRVRPEILLLNEIDYSPGGDLVRLFREKYLAVGQHVSASPDGAAEPIDYPHVYFAPVNTGRHSGLDLDRNGAVDATPGSPNYAGDCWGYGVYEGQYALAILSQHPIDAAAARTFRDFRWRDMPGARLPDDPATPTPGDYYSAEALATLPLSSKTHVDVPVLVHGRRLHLLASHPTPPVFDGPEDRNGRRNHDEIRFWVDYVGGLGVGDLGLEEESQASSYIYDDRGVQGGLGATGAFSRKAPAERAISQSPVPNPQPPSFIILGDLNGDPHDGDGSEGITSLLAAPRVLRYPAPESAGAAEQARRQGPPNDRHRGEPRHDTIDAADGRGPGNLRIDHVLPSNDLQVTGSGVFWPSPDDPLFKLVGVEPFPSSDHRLVWVDLAWPDSADKR